MGGLLWAVGSAGSGSWQGPTLDIWTEQVSLEGRGGPLVRESTEKSVFAMEGRCPESTIPRKQVWRFKYCSCFFLLTKTCHQMIGNAECELHVCDGKGRPCPWHPAASQGQEWQSQDAALKFPLPLAVAQLHLPSPAAGPCPSAPSSVVSGGRRPRSAEVSAARAGTREWRSRAEGSLSDLTCLLIAAGVYHPLPRHEEVLLNRQWLVI